MRVGSGVVSTLTLPEVTLTFTLDEFAMLGRIAETGMWELASKPHTAADAKLWDAVGAKLRMLGYEPDDCGSGS